MTKSNERRLAEELEKHAAGQEADLPQGLKNVSDSLDQAMRQTHPRPGFINQLAAQLQEQRQENPNRRPDAGLLPWAKRLLAGAVGAAALIAFALFVSNLFSGPPVVPVASDPQTATALAVNATPTPLATDPPVPPQSGGALSMPQSCIPAQPDRQPYVNITAGYCFQYPTNFHVGDVLPEGAPNVEDILAIYGPAYDPSLEPLRAGLNIVLAGPANGLTLEEVVEQEILSTLAGDEITRRETMLGGEPAIILEGLPGRVAFKEMLVTIQDGEVVQLSVTPTGADQEGATADAQRLWRAVLETFAFLSPDQLAQFAACPTDNAPYVNLLDGYCLSYPPQFDLLQFPGTLLIYTTIPATPGEGSPPASVDLTIARSAVSPDYELQTLADDLAAQHPDAEIEQGATLGPAPALVVHNPEDIGGGRRLYAHHGDMLYRLTLSSVDDSREATASLDAAWAGVTNAFTFLPDLPLETPVVHDDATREAPPEIPPTRTPPSPRDFPRHQNAVLVALADDLPVAQSQFTQLGIDVVPTFDDLQPRLQSETVEIIYLHPAVFRSLAPDVLSRLYEDGLLIVVLNVPAGEISAKLPAFSGYDDLDPQYFDSDEQFVAAAAHTYTNASQSGSWTHRDFYSVDSFWSLVGTVERQLQEATVSPTMTPPPVPFITPTPFSGTAQPGATVPPTPPTMATPTPMPTPTGKDTACTGVPRPALVYFRPLSLDAVSLTIGNPLRGAQCTFNLDAYASGAFAASRDALTYPRRDRDAGTVTIWQRPLDGRTAPLSFTTTPALSAPWFGLALSPDEQQLVWATFDEHSVDPDARFRSAVWLGEMQGETSTLLWEELVPATLPYTIEPLHISPQENVVYFARRPYGIGGTGPLPAQYNALYALSLDGGEPQPIFECPGEFDFCLNDVAFERRLLTTVAGNDEQPELRLLDFDGALLARYAPPDANYLAQPVIGPGGEVAFVAANLQETGPGTFAYEPGAIHLLSPPYTDPPRELFSTTGIVFQLYRWFDARHLLAENATGSHDLALLSLDGDPIPIPQSRTAHPLAVLQE